MESPQITTAKPLTTKKLRNEVWDYITYDGPLTMKQLRNEVWDYLIHDGNPDYLVFYFGNRVLKLPLKKMKAEARIFRHGYILGREDEEKGERMMTFQVYQRKRGIDITMDEQRHSDRLDS